MPKNKISEFSSTPANNTDIGGIDIAEGCAPSGINNAIRELMAQLKDWQSGADGDPFTVSGIADFTGEFKLDGSAGTAGQVLVSAGAGNTPTWGNAFVAGMIMLWSGSAASIPSGWLLCDGSNSTPDLRSRFVVGAGSTYAVGATGGSADAVVVSHTHVVSGTTDSTALTGSLNATSQINTAGFVAASGIVTATDVANSFMSGSGGGAVNSRATYSINATHTHPFSTTSNSTGVSGTNANLPPYLALAYIMKA